MQNYFFLDTGKRFVKIQLSDILYIETCGDYVSVVTHNGKHITTTTLQKFESVLPPDKFCRVHRSVIVSLQHIESFRSENLVIRNKTFPISLRYAKAFRQKVLVVTGVPGKNRRVVEEMETNKWEVARG